MSQIVNRLGIDFRGGGRALAECSTNDQLIRLWLHGKSSETKDAYRLDINYFLAFIENKPLWEVTLFDVQDFADALEEKGYAAATIRRRLSTVKSVMSFGHQIGVLPVNVGYPLVLPKLKDKLAERILSESQVLAMIEAESNQRNRVMLRFLYATGIRVSELCALSWRDLSESSSGGGQVTVFGKGDNTRVVAFSAETWKQLLALRKDAGKNEPVFKSRKKKGGGHLCETQVLRIVRAAGKRVGIDANVSAHWLRHCHGSHAADRGVPLHLIQKTLGHASLTTTSRYLHARPSDSSGLHLAV